MQPNTGRESPVLGAACSLADAYLAQSPMERWIRRRSWPVRTVCNAGLLALGVVAVAGCCVASLVTPAPGA